jgi:hypothetical protein
MTFQKADLSYRRRSSGRRRMIGKTETIQKRDLRCVIARDPLERLCEVGLLIASAEKSLDFLTYCFWQSVLSSPGSLRIVEKSGRFWRIRVVVGRVALQSGLYGGEREGFDYRHF